MRLLGRSTCRPQSWKEYRHNLDVLCRAARKLQTNHPNKKSHVDHVSKSTRTLAYSLIVHKSAFVQLTQQPNYPTASRNAANANSMEISPLLSCNLSTHA